MCFYLTAHCFLDLVYVNWGLSTKSQPKLSITQHYCLYMRDVETVKTESTSKPGLHSTPTKHGGRGALSEVKTYPSYEIPSTYLLKSREIKLMYWKQKYKYHSSAIYFKSHRIPTSSALEGDGHTTNQVVCLLVISFSRNSTTKTQGPQKHQTRGS